MVLGIGFTLCGCASLWMITFFNTAPIAVIGPAILIGIGGSIVIVASLAMGTDLIGPHIVSLPFTTGTFLWLIIIILCNKNNNTTIFKVS